MNKLIIEQPELSSNDKAVRVSCDIVEIKSSKNKIKKSITFDVDKKWGKYLVTENSNAYLIACLPYAMRNNMDIEVHSPISVDLLHNIEMYLVPHLVKYDNRLYATKITAKQLQYQSIKSAGAVGTGMSMGIDSFHTVYQYKDPKYQDLKLTHLFVEQVGDLFDNTKSTKHMRNVNNDTVNTVANKLELPVIYGYSNIRQVLRMNHYYTHTYTAMFNIHMLAKLFKTYFYASTEDFSHFSLVDNSSHDAALYELLSLQVLSTSSLRLLSGGASSDRIEKTEDLAKSNIAREFLRVCLVSEENCMKCMKCRRTLLTLDMQGNLDKFNKVFDISSYRKNRDEYLEWLILSYHKNRKGISVKELYKYFTGAESNTMTKLESRCLEKYLPLDQPRYYKVLNRAHKVNPKTGRRYLEFINKNKEVLFVDELYINEICYLRTKDDSIANKNKAIPKSYLNEIKFKPMKKPRRLRLIKRIRKLDPHTGTEYGEYIKPGTSIFFTDTVEIKGVQYLRTRYDARNNRELGISTDNLTDDRLKKSK